MKMIAHHGIAADIDRENGRQLLEPLANPVLAMLVAVSRAGIDAAKERPPDAPRDAVINTD